MRRIGLALVLGTCAAALMPATAGAAQQPACGQTVTANVKLAADLTCAGDGLVVGKSGITINLNGHTITGGTTAGTGISNPGGFDGVTVRNGTIARFYTGIQFTDSTGSRITELTVSAPFSADVTISGGGGNVVSHNDLNGAYSGVGVSASSGNRIADNTIGAIGFTGIGLGTASGNRVVDNSISADTALRMGGSDDNVISRNDMTTSNSGMRVTGSSRNTVTANTAPRLPLGGFSFQSGSNGNLIARNTLSVVGSLDSGVAVSDSSGNELRANVVGGGDSAFFVASTATDTLLVGNQASQGRDDGIHVDSASTTVERNVAHDNGDLGIEAVAGVTDGGGNRASGNGNPAQCIGVACAR